VQFVANARNEWVALILRPDGHPDPASALHAMFGAPDLLAAVAPLDCILLLDSPAALIPALTSLMPPTRVQFGIAATSLTAQEGTRVAELMAKGYRVYADLGAGSLPRPLLYPLSCDCAETAPPGLLPAVTGPHLARGVNSAERFVQCEQAGFTWFSGGYPLHMPASDAGKDGTSRRRLLALLALLARDADTHELETLVKQDPALSFHLLKLVNSAAFAVDTQITSFGQAITRLGRRQLQRWLQLLLYARQHEDGMPNLLLPMAALRAAQLEALCRRDGGDRDAQDLAFMCGVFSLLDRLFGMPMDELVSELRLPKEVGAALCSRAGALGQRLRLVETSPSAAELQAAGIDAMAWWQSQLHAYHWAIQVGRNV
jgi:EAL and modified HD-GYP domain-containing signal transduction protein